MHNRALLPLLLLAAHVASAQTPPAALTPEQWRNDLAYLAKELPARHVNAFARLSKEHFEAQVEDLHARIPDLPESSIRARLLRIVASLGDGHTFINWERPDVFRSIPLGFYWFTDGIFVVRTTAPHRGLLGGKLLRAGKLSAGEACKRLGAFIPNENEAVFKMATPHLLTAFELLLEIGATESPNRIRLEFERSGKPVSAEFEPVVLPKSPDWTWAYTGERPLSQRDPEAPYTAAVLDSGKTVYFRYNRCVSLPGKPFAEFAEQMKGMLVKPVVSRLIIDLRDNPGGNSGILDPWIGWLKSSPLNRKGSLFVLIGRGTYSSAILNALRLRNETAATLIGEPTAGKPNHFGELRFFELPNSHARVSYSTKYFRHSKQDTPSLLPDIELAPCSQDFLTGKDPVLASLTGR